MRGDIHYEETPAFSLHAIRASIHIGVLELDGYGDTKAAALTMMQLRARLYQAAVQASVELIEAELKELGP